MENKFPYSLVEKISFMRCAGTAEEKRAAEIIKEEMEMLGGTASFMNFPIPGSTLEQYAVRVISPYEEEVEAIPFGCPVSGNS